LLGPEFADAIADEIEVRHTPPIDTDGVKTRAEIIAGLLPRTDLGLEDRGCVSGRRE
jgi:hypothetical protein